MNQGKESKLKKGLGVFGLIVEIVLCIILIPIIVVNTIVIVKTYTQPEHIPGAFGYKAAIVMSGSMDPEIKVGSLIVLQDIENVNDLKEGDIICFMSGESAVTHRINKIEQTDDGLKFVTKGDANNTVDSVAVTEDKLEGMYKGIQFEGLGNFALFMQTTTGIILFVVLPLILIVLYDVIRRMFSDKKDKKNRRELEAELEKLRALAGNNDAENADAQTDGNVGGQAEQKEQSDENTGN